MKYTLFIFFLIITTMLHGQPFEKFLKHAGRDGPKSIFVTKDNHILMAGNSYLNSTRSVVVIKSDTSGTVNWVKKIENLQNNFIAISMIESFDGNYLLIGSTNVSGNYGTAILKLDTALNILWNKMYDFSASGIIQTLDSGFVIQSYELYSFGLSKLDKSGNFLWSKRYSPTGLVINGFNVCEGPSSELVITVGVIDNNSDRPVKMKVDASGNVIWCKYFGDIGLYDRVFAMNGSYYFLTIDNTDPFIIRTDTSGNIQSSNSFAIPNGAYLTSACTDSAGGIYLTGITQVSRQIILIHFDSNAHADIFHTYITSTQQFAPQIFATDFNNIYITSGNYGTLTDTNDVFFMHEDLSASNCSLVSNPIVETEVQISDTTVYSSIYSPVINSYIDSFIITADSGWQETDVCSVTMKTYENSHGNVFRLFPNPVANEITFELNTSSQVEIIIYNVMGVELYRRIFDNSPLRLNVTEFIPGIYFAKCISKKGEYAAIFLKF